MCICVSLWKYCEQEEMDCCKYELEIQGHKFWKKETLIQMHRHQHKDTRIMKNNVNMKPQKETSKAPITDTKEMDIYACLTENLE